MFTRQLWARNQNFTSSPPSTSPPSDRRKRRAPMPLNYHEKRKARGMLADKQGVNSIAEELQCEAWEIQELADAKPKAVRRPICTALLPCSARPLRAFGLAA